MNFSPRCNAAWPKVAHTHSNDRNAVCLERFGQQLPPAAPSASSISIGEHGFDRASCLGCKSQQALNVHGYCFGIGRDQSISASVAHSCHASFVKKTSSNTKELPQYLNTHRSKNHKLMRSTVNTPSDQILLKAQYIKGATATAACKMNFMKIQTSN